MTQTHEQLMRELNRIIKYIFDEPKKRRWVKNEISRPSDGPRANKPRR